MAHNPLSSFNVHHRQKIFNKLSSEKFDLLIVGGGITGASIFRDACLRGIKTALVEAKDFSHGTSCRSTKLIHGGLRYLKNLGFKVAHESCTERNLHMKLNKRLVRPIPFLVPVYRGKKPSKAILSIGMWLYEIVSEFQNYKFHRFISREQTLLKAPGLESKNLLGAFVYYDAAISDNRWTIETLKDGIRNGGTAINYSPVVELVKAEDKITSIVIEDSLTGKKYSAKAGFIVNATGIFSDEIRKLDDKNSKSLIRLSKGTHLVFRKKDIPLKSTIVFSSPIDKRVMFFALNEGSFLLGTTDDWVNDNPWEPMPKEKDVNYLLESAQRFMPNASITKEKVQFVYSGFRPLLFKGNDGNAKKEISPSKASREDFVEISKSGMITIVGGKLTTARLMAKKVLNIITPKIPRKLNPCRTHKLSIGGTNSEIAEGISFWTRKCPEMMPYITILFRRYGLDAHDICREALLIFEGKHPDKRAEPIRAEVQYVCRNEMVCTLEDLLERRAGFLYWNPKKRLERLDYGKHVIKKELGFSDGEFRKQFNGYRKFLKKYHTLD